MATKIWVGGTDSFDDPLAWSPSGVPGQGDTAIIQTGTAIATSQQLNGFELQLQSPASVLDISNVVFGKNFTLSVPLGTGGSATLNATGVNVNDGLIEAATPSGEPEFVPPFTITIGDQTSSPARVPGVFVNIGTIDIATGQHFAILAQSSDALLINNGVMHLDAPFMQADIGVPVQGSGTIETGHEITPAVSALLLASVPILEFGGAVGHGETLVITGSAYVQLDQPLDFHALIRGFEPLPAPTSPPPYPYSFYEPKIVLENARVTSYSVSHDVLSLWNGNSLVAELRFTDFVYTKDNFLVTTSGTTTTIEPQGILTPMGVHGHSAAMDQVLG